MSVEIIDSKKEWDEFVDNSWNGLLFHKWDFINTIKKYNKMKLFTYGIYKGKELIALFPIFLYSKYGLKAVFSPPPKTLIQELGPVIRRDLPLLRQYKKEKILRTIVENVNLEIKKHKPFLVRFKLTQRIYDVREFIWMGYTAIPNYTYFVSLTPSLDDIWKNLKGSARRGIKRAEKTNIIIKKVNTPMKILDILERRYNSQGLRFPALSKKYVLELTKVFSKNIESYYVINENDEVISGKIIIKFKDIFISWIGDTKVKGYPGLQEYVMWEFIKLAKRDGFNIFEMTGANTKRICTFKNQFNPQLSLYFTVEKTNLVGKLSRKFYFIGQSTKRW